MTGQRQDPERAIRQWLAEAAPEHAPASLRENLEQETLHPAGQSRPWPRFGQDGLRYAGRIAAAVAILAIAGTGAYFYGTSRSNRPGQGSPASPTETARPSTVPQVSDWHMVDTQWVDDQPGAFQGSHLSSIVGLSSGGFVAFIFDRSLDETVVYHSSDGTSWVDVGSLPTKEATVTEVTDTGDGTVVAVGYGYDRAANTAAPIAWTSSRDLRTWSEAILPAPANYGAQLVQAGPNGGVVAVGLELTQSTGLHFAFWISVGDTGWHSVAGPDLPEGTVVDDLSANSAGYVIRTNSSGLIETWHSVDGVAWSKAWTGPANSGPDYYLMGRPNLEAPDGTYLTIGSTSSYQVLWSSGDLIHWTMVGRPQLDGRPLYVAAAIPGGFIGGSCGENVASCTNGSVAVWTSVDALTWHQAPGTAPFFLDKLQVRFVNGFASDGSHVIVVLRDTSDGIHLLVGTARK